MTAPQYVGGIVDLFFLQRKSAPKLWADQPTPAEVMHLAASHRSVARGVAMLFNWIEVLTPAWVFFASYLHKGVAMNAYTRRTLLAGALLIGANIPSLTHADAACPVTRTGQAGMFGNDVLSVGLPEGGKFVFKPGGPGFIAISDEGLGMKVLWARGRAGSLSISGRRIDVNAPPCEQ